MTTPYTVRWGILATGWIAEMFVKDLLVDPSTRDVSDVKHEVLAVASSSSADRAQKFIKDFSCPPGTRAYGSYEELVKDKDVDVIYVATPHSHHYQNTMLCLEAGKHVLCEKAFTVNAPQAKKLVEVARSRSLFLMEAVWTRCFPLSIQIRKLIQDGAIGSVYRTIADLSFGENPEEEFGTTHRMVNMDLAGGALLDIGIYALTWNFQTLYHTMPKGSRKAPTVKALMAPYHATGSDELTSMILSFPEGPGGGPKHPAHGIALTSIRVATDPDSNGSAGPAIRIQGTKGEIQVDHPAFRPTRYRVIRRSEKEPMVEEHKVDLPGHGLFYEADEVARCLRDKKLESDTLSWDESIVIMELMDEVRKQGGMKYPDAIETLEFPTKLPR